ncbi:MAG: hypothetical protein RL885_28550 [Planctomycetota bacterium]
MRVPVLIAVCLLFTADAFADELLVSGFNNDDVLRFDAVTGRPIGSLGDVPGAQAVRFGPDGHLYACVEKLDEIRRYDEVTGALLGKFVFDDPSTGVDETGGLDGPTALDWGPSGDLFVASFETDEVLKYDGTTGQFLGVFVAAASGGLDGPDNGMQFGADGTLWVPSFWNSQVMRFDATSGAFLDAPMTSADGLNRPRDFIFHSDGFVYVSSEGNGRVYRRLLSGGAWTLFTASPSAAGIAFGPDGSLYVANSNRDSVRRYDAQGTFLDVFIPRAAGLNAPVSIRFVPDFGYRLKPISPGMAGVPNTLTAERGSPGSNEYFLISLQTGLGMVPSCGTMFDLSSPVLLGSASADAGGQATWTQSVPAGAFGVRVFFQAIELASCQVTRVQEHTFQ